MHENKYGIYTLGMFLFLGLFASVAFAEVDQIQVDNELFYKNEQIKISGTVETGSTGIVTIVIRDQDDDFVLLTHSKINQDDSFEKKIKVENQFSKHGNYSATGFILNMTDAEKVAFDVSLNNFPIEYTSKSSEVMTNEVTNPISSPDDDQNELLNSINTVSRVTFVDPAKDPVYYVERYYSEPYYKSWFDRNYPGQTIEEAVGYVSDLDEVNPTVKVMMDSEIIPEAQASSFSSSSSIAVPSTKVSEDLDFAQISLVVASLGILFGAVYGIKRQADSNTKQILLNKSMIRKKILDPIIGQSPKEIIQTRLAKGEISLDEYDRLNVKIGC